MAGASPSPRAEVVVPPDWASATAFISSYLTPPVVVVCGPKNGGKSTLSRLLLNSLLPRYGRVGYSDTDVGQPEFSPPGCLSFHVVDEAIADLLNPTLREAERFLKRKDAFGTREHRLVEYFKQCFPIDISLTTNKEVAYALTSLPPYEVSFSDVTVMHLHCQVARRGLWRSLNATMVGLAISCDSSEAPRSLPWCVGLGIVGGVDVQRGLLYVITPVPLQCLQSVDLLVQGLIEIPTSLLQVTILPWQ